ncbi:hypothetical protein CLTEP_27390 [Clostridium tepidiprofundi DSM 19306]|uniref:DUF4241 domain-containing protein n=1 Tax=Clostridium tepidiprofundi DSM 19306 TaxID=1121338 RepID=A0A151AN34_9CLOT|nr:DUF4241 domain-containing protein [Clostridium tepidiprofundi]KYH29044.1 hypothetical protein CLTEP_27390 [Clostridium tepidiprofundi DSM 19306]
MINLGTFENKSGKMVISDPIYELGTWCQGVLDVKKGKYNAFLIKSDEGNWGIRCKEILVFHEEVRDIENIEWDLTDINVGVDSGQAGFFDFKTYRKDKIIPEGSTSFMPDEPWYSTCCDLTLSEEQAGVFESGLVSSSGYGDGSYSCFVAKNENNEIIALRIVFISDNDI